MRQLRKCGWFIIDNQVFAFWWKIVAKTEILPAFLWLILTASAPGYDKVSSLGDDSQRCHCFKAQSTAYSAYLIRKAAVRKHFQTSLNVFHSICTIFESEKIRNMSDVLLGIMGIGSGEVIIIALVVLLLFGGRKIPELMRGIGKGIRSFKDGMNEVKEEIDKPVDNNTDKKK